MKKVETCKAALANAAFGTKEWALINKNLIVGCPHNCKYCYAKANVVRRQIIIASEWETERLNCKGLPKSNLKKYDGTIFYPSTHDISPKFLKEHIIYLQRILYGGNHVLIVSKPHLECISAICEKFPNFKKQILFRFTIGSYDSKTLKFWEPGAPSFEERLKCLKHAFNKGFQTSVSCEPLLCFDVEKLINKTIPYVSDSFWIGKVNMLKQRLTLNGANDSKTLKEAQKLLDWQNNDANYHALYKKYKRNSKIKWKESVKKVLGIEVPTQAGLDI